MERMFLLSHSSWKCSPERDLENTFIPRKSGTLREVVFALFKRDNWRQKTNTTAMALVQLLVSEKGELSRAAFLKFCEGTYRLRNVKLVEVS